MIIQNVGSSKDDFGATTATLSGDPKRVWANVEDTTSRAINLGLVNAAEVSQSDISVVLPYGVDIAVGWRVALGGVGYRVTYVYSRPDKSLEAFCRTTQDGLIPSV